MVTNLFSKLAALEKEVKERSKKDTEKEQKEAEVPLIEPGFGGRLMLTQGNGFPAQAPPPMMMPNGTGFGMPPVRQFSLRLRCTILTILVA